MPDSAHSIGGRKGAHLSWAQTSDRSARTAPARRAALARFEALVDPDGKLTDTERARRASHLQKAHMADLALRSARARKAKAVKKSTIKSPPDAPDARSEAGRPDDPTRATSDDHREE
jgi:hypothetical protein